MFFVLTEIPYMMPDSRLWIRKDASLGLLTLPLFAYFYIHVKGKDYAAP